MATALSHHFMEGDTRQEAGGGSDVASGAAQARVGKEGDSERKETVLTGLRALLAEKFPQAPQHEAGGYTLPLSPTEPDLELPLGRVTEVSGSLASGGLFIEAVLRSAYARRGMMALVDAAGSFDPVPLLAGGAAAGGAGPGAMENARLDRLLWVLCGKVERAIKAADLLLRDGNLSTVVLDLQMSPLAELRRIPASTWYRFQRILEPTSLLFVVLTPLPMVSSAAERFELDGAWSLRAMREPRAELPVQVRRGRRAGAARKQAPLVSVGSRGGVLQRIA